MVGILLNHLDLMSSSVCLVTVISVWMRQSVSLGSTCYQEEAVKCKVPKSWVLCTFMSSILLMLLNYLPSMVLKVHMYADGTQAHLYCCHAEALQVIHVFTRTPDTLFDWMHLNWPLPSLVKTQLIWFGTRHQLSQNTAISIPSALFHPQSTTLVWHLNLSWLFQTHQLPLLHVL